MRVWALTGPAPNPLATAAHAAVQVRSPEPAVIQEVHGVLVHVLCAEVDRHVLGADGPSYRRRALLDGAATDAGRDASGARLPVRDVP
jgi:D-sedoheptulose 7-phosphate isomerase